LLEGGFVCASNVLLLLLLLLLFVGLAEFGAFKVILGLFRISEAAAVVFLGWFCCPCFFGSDDDETIVALKAPPRESFIRFLGLPTIGPTFVAGASLVFSSLLAGKEVLPTSSSSSLLDVDESPSLSI
jgi:hypothetical protein